MTTLFAVVSTIGGFAREDAPTAHCLGVFTDKVVADQVKLLAGHGAEVKPVELDAVAPGFVESARQLGFEIGKPRATCKP